MTRGRFYVTPYAVRRFRERLRPDLHARPALETLIRLTTAGRCLGPYNGSGIRAMVGEGVRVELWRAPRVGRQSDRRPESRARFIVAYGPGDQPQVVTVLPNPRPGWSPPMGPRAAPPGRGGEGP